jgi:hypothetical protein
MDFVGVLTIYTRINSPNGDNRSKRVTAHKNYRCENMNEAKETLAKMRDANPEMFFEAEFIITRYVD